MKMDSKGLSALHPDNVLHYYSIKNLQNETEVLGSREEYEEVKQDNSSTGMNDKYMYCLRFRKNKLFNLSKLYVFFKNIHMVKTMGRM